MKFSQRRHGEVAAFYCPTPSTGVVGLTDLPSTFLTCHQFTRIQKALVGQINSEPPNSDHDLFFSFQCNLGSWCIQATFCHMLDHNLIKKWVTHCCNDYEKMAVQDKSSNDFLSVFSSSLWVASSSSLFTFPLWPFSYWSWILASDSLADSPVILSGWAVNLWWWPLCSSSSKLSFQFQTSWPSTALYSH